MVVCLKLLNIYSISLLWGFLYPAKFMWNQSAKCTCHQSVTISTSTWWRWWCVCFLQAIKVIRCGHFCF